MHLFRRQAVLFVKSDIDYKCILSYNQIMKKQKITMDQIAKKVGVSKSIVSIAMSNKYGVSEEVRSKIFLAAHEMGYDFSKIKSYEKRTKNKITLFIANKTVLSETFWSDIILGIENAVSENNMYMQVFVFNGETHLDTMLSEIHESKTSGIIMIKDYDNNLIQKMSMVTLPIVVVDPKQVTSDSDHVSEICVNNYESSYFCANHFIELGHKNIAFYGDRTFSLSFQQRYNGFRDAILNSNKKIRFTKMVEKAEEGNVVCNIGQIKEKFSEKDYPTAVLCANDLIAFLLFEKLTEMGFNIPNDISIVGFDNLEKSAWLNLSTFHVPKFEMGKRAVEKLIEIIKNPKMLSEKTEIFSKYIERGSVSKK